MMRRIRLPAAWWTSVATTAVLAACGGPAGDADTAAMEHADHAAPADHAAHAAPAGEASHAHHGLVATAGRGYTVADVEFMQMMMGHHAQAVTMAEMATSHGAGPEVTTLAQRIDISQRDEMAFMRTWLTSRGQAVPTDEQMRQMEMPGLVAAADLARLDGLRGREFDRLFLELMIEHHLGALQMVDDLFASPGAVQDSELFPFVTDVGADQLDEIGIMERILASFDR